MLCEEVLSSVSSMLYENLSFLGFLLVGLQWAWPDEPFGAAVWWP